MAEFKGNLRNINSPYILKEIFSYLEEKEKLNIIMYNKELQKDFFS